MVGTIETRRAVRRAEPSVSGYARHIGRVGALAVALGVGAVFAWPVMAFADTTGSAGSSATDSPVSSSADSPSAATPRSKPRLGSHRGSRSADSATPTTPAEESDATSDIGSDTVRGSTARSAAAEGSDADRGSHRAARVGVAPIRQIPATTSASIPNAADPAPTAEPVPAGEPAQPAEPAEVAHPTGVTLALVTATAVEAPVMTAPKPAAARGSVTGLSAKSVSWLAPGGDGGAPAAAPLMWAVAGFVRRDLGKDSTALNAAASGAPATISAPLIATPKATSTGSLTADPFGDLLRIFIGNGTADNPNAGILFGSGYSYTAATCTSGPGDVWNWLRAPR
jgi:hypothetical protein